MKLCYFVLLALLQPAIASASASARLPLKKQFAKQLLTVRPLAKLAEPLIDITAGYAIAMVEQFETKAHRFSLVDGVPVLLHWPEQAMPIVSKIEPSGGSSLFFDPNALRASGLFGRTLARIKRYFSPKIYLDMQGGGDFLLLSHNGSSDHSFMVYRPSKNELITGEEQSSIPDRVATMLQTKRRFTIDGEFAYYIEEGKSLVVRESLADPSQRQEFSGLTLLNARIVPSRTSFYISSVKWYRPGNWVDSTLVHRVNLESGKAEEVYSTEGKCVDGSFAVWKDRFLFIDEDGYQHADKKLLIYDMEKKAYIKPKSLEGTLKAIGAEGEKNRYKQDMLIAGDTLYILSHTTGWSSPSNIFTRIDLTQVPEFNLSAPE